MQIYQVIIRQGGPGRIQLYFRSKSEVRLSESIDRWRRSNGGGAVLSIRVILWVTRFERLLANEARRSPELYDEEDAGRKLRRIKSRVDFCLSEIRRSCPDSTLGCYLDGMKLVTYRELYAKDQDEKEAAGY